MCYLNPQKSKPKPKFVNTQMKLKFSILKNPNRPEPTTVWFPEPIQI